LIRRTIRPSRGGPRPATTAISSARRPAGWHRSASPTIAWPHDGIESPNIAVFREQVELFRRLLLKAPPSPEQAGNIDYMLAAGQLFTLVVYAQLILENARIHRLDVDLREQIFAFLISDFSTFALQMILTMKIRRSRRQSTPQ